MADKVTTFTDLCLSNTRAYLLKNQHGNGTELYQQVVVNLLSAAGLNVDVGVFQAGHAQGKKMAYSALKTGKYGIIIPMGGDGTINKAAAAALKVGGVVVAPVAGGTFNHFSSMLYQNADSHKPWLNVLRMLESMVMPIDIGVIEPVSVHLTNGQTVKVQKQLRKKGHFLLAASLGAQATVASLMPKKLKYYADSLAAGLGKLVALLTVLLHVRKFKFFPAEIKDSTSSKSWIGKTRAVIVASANYAWQKERVCVDNGMLESAAIASLWELVTHKTESQEFRDGSVSVTVPYNTKLAVDGSTTNLNSKLACLGEIASVTYKCHVKKVPVLVPYNISQPLLSQKVVAPVVPVAKPLKIVGDNFLSGDVLKVVVSGSACLTNGFYVIYGQAQGESIAIRVTDSCLVARSSASSPESIGNVAYGSAIFVVGCRTDWGLNASQIVL